MSDLIMADRPYKVLVKCPSCSEIEFIRVGLVARLDQTRAGAHLGLKVKADTIDHVCGQLKIPDPPGGELKGQEPLFEKPPADEPAHWAEAGGDE